MPLSVSTEPSIYRNENLDNEYLALKYFSPMSSTVTSRESMD